MASPTRTLTVNFVGRTKNLERSFKRVSKGSELMSSKMMRATRTAGIGFGALAGVAIGAAVALKPMIDKAAAMEEALSKNQLLLGESSKAVEQFAETSLESFGVTNLAALQATGVFASLGDAMGMSEEASASMATTLTGLAGDLSSLHDVSVETALTALRAGLIGEAEPLRKLGILLDAATIKTKALAMGLVENTKDALTPAIKSQAAYALILEKGAIAMGDFTRTSDSATNVSKQLAGQWEEMQIVIGTMLLPAFTALVTHLVDVVMPAITDFFEDPTWEAGGLLMGQTLLSGFVKGLAGITLALITGFLNPIGVAFGIALDMLDPFGDDDGAPAPAPGAGMGGRDDPDFDRGDAEELAAAAAAAAAPSAFLPGGDSINDLALAAIDAALAAALEAVAASAAEAARIAAFTEEDITGTGPGLALVGAAAAGSAAGELERFGSAGGPGQRGGAINVTIVAPALDVAEVVWDALGKAVQENGPMPPHWQMSAT
jgi:hypothetical protein